MSGCKRVIRLLSRVNRMYLQIPPLIILGVIISFSQSLSSNKVMGTEREHWLMSDQVCPNPIRNVNLPRNVNDQVPRTVILNYLALNLAWKEQHCFLMLEDESRVLIRAVSSSVDPWNYTEAQQCEGMLQIKLQLNEAEIHVGPKPWCKIERWKDNPLKLHFFNPQLSVYPKGRLGLFFSTESWAGRLNVLDVTAPIEDGRPKFLQFAFYMLTKTPQGEKCNLIVQQYAINPKKLECRSWDVIYQHCGIYNCEEESGSVLERMNFSLTPSSWNQSDLFINETTDPYLHILRAHFTEGLAEAKREQFEVYLTLLEIIAFVTACVTAFYVFMFSYFKRRKLNDPHHDLEDSPSYYDDLLVVESSRCSHCHHDTQF